MRDVYFRGAFSEIFLYYKSFCLFVFIVKEGPAGMLHRQTAKSLDYIASHTDSSRMIARFTVHICRLFGGERCSLLCSLNQKAVCGASCVCFVVCRQNLLTLKVPKIIKTILYHSTLQRIPII